MLSAKLSVGDLVRRILAGHERTVVLVDSENRLFGVVSQGDLLKAIWNGATVGDPIVNLVNPNPLVLIDGSYSDQDAINLFLERGVLVVPVVNKERKLVRSVNIRELLRKRFENNK